MHITFGHPIYLWYLFSIPLLVITHFLFLRRARKKAMMFANFEALKRVTGKKLSTTNSFQLALRIVVVLCLVLAASDITIWYEGTAPDNDFVIAIDTSASMSAKDITDTRLEGAKRVASLFVDKLTPRSRVGVVSFSTTAFVEQVPSRDPLAAKSAISRLEIEKAGGTDIAGAIITSTNIMLSSEKGKVIIILTDGSNTYNAFIGDSVRRGVDYAVDKKVVIHTIGVGRESGPIGYLPKYYNISGVFNEDLMIDLAKSTGGSYFIAKSDESLNQAFEYLLERSEKRYIPLSLSAGLLLAGIMILFIEWGLINTRFRKIP